MPTLHQLSHLILDRHPRQEVRDPLVHGEIGILVGRSLSSFAFIMSIAGTGSIRAYCRNGKEMQE